MKPTILIFNGWAAGPEAWELVDFPHDWIFNYIEELDGLPQKVIAEHDEVILIGFSMGGSMALRELLRTPGKVKGLVLISSTPRMMEELDAGGRVIWKGLSPHRLAALKYGTEMIFANDPSPIYEKPNLERGLAFLEGVDLRADLESLMRSEAGESARKMKVEIFQSERDGIVKPGNASYLKGVFPQANVHMIEGTEHVLPIQVPELISHSVNQIIESCR